MSTLQGEAPPPTFRSILAGIAAAILLLLAFLNLPSLFKYAGAALAFLPSKMGLVQVVKADEVIPMDLSTSPTPITFTKAGNYVVYTDYYDLLVVHDAIVEKGSEPWINIESENGEKISVHLVSRGLSLYDTPLAKGRPVATFNIELPGTYDITHPTRPATGTIVPNYTTGRENWITFLYIAELVILFIVIRDIRAAIRARNKKAREQLLSQ